MKDTWPLLERIPFPALARQHLVTLQVNVGYRCNQSCVHCHVNAGPNRDEEMSARGDRRVLARRAGTASHVDPRHHRRRARAQPALSQSWCGAPARMGVRVIDRCNLTILDVPVRRTSRNSSRASRSRSSPPCPATSKTTSIGSAARACIRSVDPRASNASTRSATARDRSSCSISSTIPQGPSLPPPHRRSKHDYKRVLGDRYGIVFNRLYTLANMPIQRFGAILICKGEFDRYLDAAARAHLDANLEGVMCRNLISVDWRGRSTTATSTRCSICRDRSHNGARVCTCPTCSKPRLRDDRSGLAGHCYGCTAGQGSSCGGALREAAE